MIKSMTAYGRSSKASSLGRWNVEIHSVNRKFLDLSIQMPKEFLVFDIEIRKALSLDIQRGQVTVKVSLSKEGLSRELISQQVAQLKTVQSFYAQVAKELNLPANEIASLAFLLGQRDVVVSRDMSFNEAELQVDLMLTVQEALTQYLLMKEAEGRVLGIEIQKYLSHIQGKLSELEQYAPVCTQNYKKRLIERIQELKVLDPSDEDRILREVMIYAEKTDIAEEITRLTSHLQQFYALFSSKDRSVGRAMDFLLQEMNREVNTMCSKSDTTEMTLVCMQMKGELEKIREQVQNIE
ncbi:MAG: YicC family protein [Chlamydiae bacterium]|jgi:uncharacterized protein (TIGR00255 family)|nr:YicC family protein [Chlamydiota bacterium]